MELIEWDKIDAVLWDWNGTLLDDVEVNRRIINRMLSKRGLKPMDLPVYKGLFCFPVQAFQQQIGFNFEEESMQDISDEYHAFYKRYEKEIRLNAEALFILDAICTKGVNQYILSAAGKTDLIRMLNHFGLENRFAGIYGAADNCAIGKTEIGKYLIQDCRLDPNRTLLVGDTLHDAEVAGALGIHCVLYAGGHNSFELLAGKGAVITNLKELLSF